MSRKLLVWIGAVVSAFALGLVLWSTQNNAQLRAVAEVQQVAAQAQTQIAATPTTSRADVSGMPVRLIIPNLAIDVGIKTGAYDSHQKTYLVDATSADIIPATAPASNKQGAIFIYGHDSNAVLGKTRDIATGDKAYVYTDNNHVFEYAFQSAQVVKPTDTWVLDGLNGGEARLKLMTCTGPWDQSRRIMTFTLKAAA